MLLDNAPDYGIIRATQEKQRRKHTMTMLEKIEAVRKIQDYEFEIENKLEEIIKGTCDPKCYDIDEWHIEDGHIAAWYWYSCRGESDRNIVNIPIEWFTEGFDYKAAYEESIRKAEERRKLKELEEKNRTSAKETRNDGHRKARSRQRRGYVERKCKGDNSKQQCGNTRGTSKHT